MAKIIRPRTLALGIGLIIGGSLAAYAAGTLVSYNGWLASVLADGTKIQTVTLVDKDGAVVAGGGGGGPATIADGADVTQGAKADAACGTATGTCSMIALQKYLNSQLGGTGATGAAAPASAVYTGFSSSGNLTGVSSTTPLPTAPLPSTSAGLSKYLVEPAASDNHANIKNGAGQVYHISVTNSSGAIQYLRLYNAASGFNGCNSATNIQAEYQIPFQTSNVGGFVEDIAMGLEFTTGISICYTGGFGQTDTTNATAAKSAVNILYK